MFGYISVCPFKLPLNCLHGNHYYFHDCTMTFYFKPPRGSLPLHKLEECIHERIQYLKYIETVTDITQCEDTSFKFDYLTDGSALDRTGHFMLRLISLKQLKLKDFILRRETLLFERRLMCSSAHEVKNELKTALRHIKEILSTGLPLLQYKQFLSAFIAVCTELLFGNSVAHSFQQSHSENCDQMSIRVPFTLCLDLVASRAVDLSNGFAVVPCGKWSQLLSCLFLEHMKQGLQQLSSSVSFKSAWFDDRVKLIARTLNASFGKSVFPLQSSHGDILCQNIDVKSVLFPPCMINLHHTLRSRHRLTHNSRFYYSLFLKDIGMPLIESVEFWSQEYVQPHSSCASCSHSWQKDGRRYLYSIRHMYGLEGSRREYQSHSCKQLQSLSLGPSAEGGCPFVHFDKRRLIRTLHQKVTSNESITEFILGITRFGASQACHLYHDILEKICNDKPIEQMELTRNVHVFSKPAEFYATLASKLKECDHKKINRKS